MLLLPRWARRLCLLKFSHCACCRREQVEESFRSVFRRWAVGIIVCGYFLSGSIILAIITALVAVLMAVAFILAYLLPKVRRGRQMAENPVCM